jgi:DNA-binding response OmpR family regulator
VEDDFDLNETIVEYLAKFFQVESVLDGEEAVVKVYENRYDLIVLDVKLPKIDGFEVAKQIRQFSQIPIIFLTSLDSEKDVEQGFLSGGDDYIRKPFSLKELKYRIDAIFKRVYGGRKEVELPNGYRFDLESLELKKGEKSVHLKPKVAQLLKFFIQNRGRIVTKEEIFNYLYRYDEEPNQLSLWTFITTLRQLLGKRTIETIKGVGYRFTTPGSQKGQRE